MWSGCKMFKHLSFLTPATFTRRRKRWVHVRSNWLTNKHRTSHETEHVEVALKTSAQVSNMSKELCLLDTSRETPRSYKAPNSFGTISSVLTDLDCGNWPPLWIHINRDPQLHSLLTAAAVAVAVSLRFSQSSYPSSQSSPWYYRPNYIYQLPPLCSSSPSSILSHSLIDFNSLCFSTRSLTLSVLFYDPYFNLHLF